MCLHRMRHPAVMRPGPWHIRGCQSAMPVKAGEAEAAPSSHRAREQRGRSEEAPSQPAPPRRMPAGMAERVGMREPGGARCRRRHSRELTRGATAPRPCLAERISPAGKTRQAVVTGRAESCRPSLCCPFPGHWSGWCWRHPPQPKHGSVNRCAPLSPPRPVPAGLAVEAAEGEAVSARSHPCTCGFLSAGSSVSLLCISQ